MKNVKKWDEPPPIDRGWAWAITLGVFLGSFMIAGTIKSSGIILMELIHQMGLSTTTGTLSMSLTFMVYAIAGPLSILTAKQLTTRKVVVFGAVAGSIGYALSSLLVKGTYFIVVFGISLGFAKACVFSNGFVILNQYFKTRRSTATGLGLMGSSAGFLAMPPLLEYLLETYGISGTLLLQSAIILHGAIAGMLYRPIEHYTPIFSVATENDKSLHYYQEEKVVMSKQDFLLECQDFQIKEQDSPAKESKNSIETVIDKTTFIPLSTKKQKQSFISKLIDFDDCKNYVTLLYVIVVAVTYFAFANFIVLLPGIVQEKGITSYQKAMLVSICGMGDFIAKIIIGFIGDTKLGRRYVIMATSAFGIGIAILLVGITTSYPLIAVECGVYGFFGSCYFCLLTVVLVDFVGLKAMPSNWALTVFFMSTASATGYPFLGALKEATQSYTIVTIVCGLSLLSGGVMLLFYPVVKRLDERRRRATSRVLSP